MRLALTMNEWQSPWTRLGLGGAGLAFSVLFVHVPAALWVGNVTELHLPVGRVLSLGLAVAVVGTALFVLVLRRLSDDVRSIVASLASALGVIEWAYGLVLVGGMQVLDGIHILGVLASHSVSGSCRSSSRFGWSSLLCSAAAPERPSSG